MSPKFHALMSAVVLLGAAQAAQAADAVRAERQARHHRCWHPQTLTAASSTDTVVPVDLYDMSRSTESGGQFDPPADAAVPVALVQLTRQTGGDGADPIDLLHCAAWADQTLVLVNGITRSRWSTLRRGNRGDGHGHELPCRCWPSTPCRCWRRRRRSSTARTPSASSTSSSRSGRLRGGGRLWPVLGR